MAAQSLKEKTAKGLFWGGVNNSVQQIINFSLGILLLRILSPGDYGLVGMLAIFTSIASLLQDSGFTAAIINKKNCKHEDYNAVFWFSTLVGTSIYIILFFAAPLIAAFFKQPALENLSRVMFLWFLFGCTGTVHAAILQKKLMVKERTHIDVISLSAASVAGVIMALLGWGYWTLAIQTVLHSLIGTILKWHYSAWRPTLKINLNPLRELLPFSSKILFTGIFTQVNNNIFSVLLGRFYSKEDVGCYDRGNKWMYMGYSLIWNMVNSVSQPILAQAADNIDYQRNVFQKLIRFVAFTSFPLMLGFALIAPELIPIVATDTWIGSIPILQILCIWGAVTPLSNLYSSMLISRGKSDIHMYSTMTLGVIQLIAIFFSIQWGIMAMLIIFVIINISWLFVWHYFAWKTIKVRLSDVLLKDILPFLFITAFALSCAWYISSFAENAYLRLSIKIIVSAVLYIAIMYFSKAVIFNETITFFRKYIFKR